MLARVSRDAPTACLRIAGGSSVIERQGRMKKTYSTREAAGKIGVAFRTVNRWLADGKIKPSVAVPMGGGRTLWRWSMADIARARKIDRTPGHKAKNRGAK